MDFNWNEWLNLALRWFHVFAGILWIGQTFFFTWLDARFQQEEKVWLVHSGGFYTVDKLKAPEQLPATLHWFKWEAALTWLSGFVLLNLMYYHGGLMVDPDVADIGVWTASGIGLAAIVLGWIVYDLLWLSPLARNETLGAVVSYVLLVAVTYALAQKLSGRAAYMHVGALLGTIMAANVWQRILPAQRRLIAAVKEGVASPEASGLAARAKQRSKHNTFMVVPVVFIMLSNHYPVASYGNRYGWVILAALLLVGAGAAKVLRRV